MQCFSLSDLFSNFEHSSADPNGTACLHPNGQSSTLGGCCLSPNLLNAFLNAFMSMGYTGFWVSLLLVLFMNPFWSWLYLSGLLFSVYSYILFSSNCWRGRASREQTLWMHGSERLGASCTWRSYRKARRTRRRDAGTRSWLWRAIGDEKNNTWLT